MESSTKVTWNDEQWRPRAECKAVDPTLFFPVGVTGEAERQILRAKFVCEACLVQMQCLEFALRTNQEYGIWGGKDEEERRIIRRMRRQQRKFAQAS